MHFLLLAADAFDVDKRRESTGTARLNWIIRKVGDLCIQVSDNVWDRYVQGRSSGLLKKKGADFEIHLYVGRGENKCGPSKYEMK